MLPLVHSIISALSLLSSLAVIVFLCLCKKNLKEKQLQQHPKAERIQSELEEGKAWKCGDTGPEPNAVKPSITTDATTTNTQLDTEETQKESSSSFPQTSTTIKAESPPPPDLKEVSSPQKEPEHQAVPIVEKSRSESSNHKSESTEGVSSDSKEKSSDSSMRSKTYKSGSRFQVFEPLPVIPHPPTVSTTSSGSSWALSASNTLFDISTISDF